MKILLGIILSVTMLGAAWSQQPSAPPSSLQWNRFETKNFEIMSISKNEGESLYNTLEFMRRWIYERWGLKEVDFSVKCKVFVTPDVKTQQRLFNKGTQMYRIDHAKDGQISALTIWVAGENDWYISTLPYLLTEICLEEFEQAYKIKLPLWFHLGAAGLNRSVPNIRQELGSVAKIYKDNLPCFWTEDILTMTKEKLDKYQAGNRQWFDKESSILCLFLIKTYGKIKFLNFLEKSMEKPPQGALGVIQKADYADFDRSFNNYMYNITTEIISRQTPSGYLNIS